MPDSPGYDVQTGNTASITFGTSAFAATIVRIGAIRRTREALPFDNLASTNYIEKIPADLADIDGFTVRMRFNSGKVPPINGAPETITITLPLEEAELTAATISGTGFITGDETPELANNEVAEGSYDVTFDNKGTEYNVAVGTI